MRGCIQWTLLLGVFAGGCKQGQPVPTDNDIATILVSPSELTIQSGPSGADPVQFAATAVYENGQEEPLEVVAWEVSNHSAGSIDETGLFAPSTTNGGVTWITATLDDVAGNATATVVYQEVRNEQGVDETLFDGVPTETTGSWLYPSDGVNLPRNTPSIHFQWADLAATAYRLHFQSELTDLTIYCTDRQYLLDNTTWVTIASANAGGAVTVRLTAAVGDQVLAEKPITVQVNRFDAYGTIIYFNTGIAGLSQIPFGGTTSDYITQAQTGHCVGCHVLSNAGGAVAFSYDGGNGSIGIKDVDELTDILGYGAEVWGNFKTFSPDGRWLLGTSFGNLYLRDMQTGGLAPVRELADATHVDWSPDGALVAFTQSTGHVDDWHFGGGSTIAVMEHEGDGVFSNVRTLVTPPEGKSAYYPAWSPDGNWLAYNVSTGDWYDDPDAEVWIVDRDAVREPIRLDLANSTGQLYNSWPRWGPLPDDDILWLTFGSRRPYGFQTDGRPQIWVTAFDPERAEVGMDPSWPSFWLPGQSLVTGNHIPQWVE